MNKNEPLRWNSRITMRGARSTFPVWAVAVFWGTLIALALFSRLVVAVPRPILLGVFLAVIYACARFDTRRRDV